MPRTTNPSPSDQLLAADRLEPFEAGRRHRPGVTAVLRLDRDCAHLPQALAPLLRAVEKVIVVDHRTAPGQVDVVRDVAADLQLGHRVQVLGYPFPLSPPGRPHLETRPDSVHSLVHFHNWVFSHVRTSFAIRWEPSLVLTPDGEALLAAFNWQVGHHRVNLRLPKHPLYVESPTVAYLDLAWANVQQRGHPAAAGFAYVKGFEREVLQHPAHTRNYGFPRGSALEVRALDEAGMPAGRGDALSAWTRYDLDTVTAIRDGRWQSRRDLHRLEVPSGSDAVTHASNYLAGL